MDRGAARAGREVAEAGKGTWPAELVTREAFPAGKETRAARGCPISRRTGRHVLCACAGPPACTPKKKGWRVLCTSRAVLAQPAQDLLAKPELEARLRPIILVHQMHRFHVDNFVLGQHSEQLGVLRRRGLQRIDEFQHAGFESNDSLLRRRSRGRRGRRRGRGRGRRRGRRRGWAARGAAARRPAPAPPAGRLPGTGARCARA